MLNSTKYIEETSQVSDMEPPLNIRGVQPLDCSLIGNITFENSNGFVYSHNPRVRFILLMFSVFYFQKSKKKSELARLKDMMHGETVLFL